MALEMSHLQPRLVGKVNQRLGEKGPGTKNQQHMPLCRQLLGAPGVLVVGMRRGRGLAGARQ